MMLFLFLSTSSALECFSYSCYSSEDSPCVTRQDTSNTSLILNIFCSSKCNRTKLESSFSSDSSLTYYNCTSESTPESLYTLIENEKIACPSRSNLTFDYSFDLDTFKEYFQNNSALNCTYSKKGELLLVDELYIGEDEDEVYVNSSYCGFDGIAYCTPSMSSEIFYKYWEVCDENGGKIDLKTMELWKYMQERYINIITAPYCAEDLFEDLAVPSLDFIIDAFSAWLSVALLNLIV